MFPDNGFEKKSFSKNPMFYHFRILGEKISDNRRKSFDSVVKTTFIVSTQRVKEIGYFEQFLVSFYPHRAQRKKKSDFQQTISSKIVGTTFYVCTGTVWEEV